MNVYYHTEDRFPTTHRRSEIIKKTNAELPPLDNAYNAVKNKNSELVGMWSLSLIFVIFLTQTNVEMTMKYDRGTEQNINPFTMVLKGVIDAAVNGGVKKYQEAFFFPEYVADHPTHAQRVEELKQCLYDQVALSPFFLFFPPLLLIFVNRSISWKAHWRCTARSVPLKRSVFSNNLRVSSIYFIFYFKF
jgi:hypothetical protein